MPQTQTLFKVFVASPSDLAEERKILGEVIDDINRTESDAHNIILKLLKWETDSRPGFRRGGPQDVINQQIGNDYDIFLGIMWGRFGSPTPRAKSGTEEEFDLAFSRWKKSPESVEIMFYFKNAGIPPSTDLEQLKQVQKFKEKISDQGGLYYEFQDAEEFRTQARRHLIQVIQDWPKPALSAPETAETTTPPPDRQQAQEGGHMPNLRRKAMRDRMREQRKDPKVFEDEAVADMNVIPKDEWDRKVSGVRQKGELFAREMRRQGKPFKAVILAPKEVPGGAEVAMQAVVIQRDWKAAAKLEMVEDANNFLTKARQVDIFHPDLLGALRSVLEEEPLPMHSIGEFLILYGKFEQKYGLSTSKETREKMEELVKGEEVHLKEYDKNKNAPLPYVVRNILAHIGTDQNKLLVTELNLAKNLLEAWLRR